MRPPPLPARSLEVDRSVPELKWATPGEEGGRKELQQFIDTRLVRYDAKVR